MSIKLSNVTYTYGIGTPFEKTALYDTDVEIHEGEFVGIIGHTGSGKSTLVQILNDVPVAAELAERLRQKGLDLPDSIITEEELGDALCQLS